MAESGRGRWGFIAACAIALATIVAAYSNTFENVFHFDDAHVIVSNLYIRSLDHVPRFFRDASTYSSLPANQAYRPLLTTTLALDYRLGGGLNPAQFHRTQLVLLVLLAVGVFLVFLRVLNMAAARPSNRWTALLAATLFAVHATNTETINILHVRTELLSALGLVGSFVVYFYLPGSRRWHLYLLPMVIGALAKTPAVMFAPIFAVYVVLFEEGLSLPDMLAPRKRPALVAAVRRALPAMLIAVAMFFFVEGQNSPTLGVGGGTRLEYARSQTFNWLHYGTMFFFPTGLSADTDWKLIPDWTDTRVIAGLAFIAALLRLMWATSKTQAQRPVTFGLAWFILALLPASSIFPLAEVTNDHRAFLAYIGMALAVGSGLAVLVERWRATAPALRPVISTAAVALALVAIGGNAAAAYERNKVFLTEESFWRDVVEKSPANGRGLMNYGLVHMGAGRYADAKQLFDRAAVYTPNYATLEINLAIVTGRLGQNDVAEAHFARALQLQPADPNAHYFFARWLIEQGRTAEALPALRRAVELSPSDMYARSLLLDTYARTGQETELKALAAETLRLSPGDPQATKYLNGAGQSAGGAFPVPPTFSVVDGLLNASLQLYQAGNFEASLMAAKKALEIKPDSAEAHNNMAAAFAALRRWDEAIAEARLALQARPDFELARNNLRWAETEKAKAATPPK